MIPDDLFHLFAPAGGPGLLWSLEPVLPVVAPTLALVACVVLEFLNPE